MNKSQLRVSHLSDNRQIANALNGAMRKIDAIDLSADQNTVTIDRATDVTGSLNVSGHYSVATVQVVGARITGWTAATGTPARGAFAAAAAGTASAAYVQAELQGALNRIAALEARLIAYDADLRTHGLIGT